MSNYCEIMPASSGTFDSLSKSKRRFTSESNQSTSLSKFCSFILSTLFIAASGSAYSTDHNKTSYEKIIEKSESHKDVVTDIKTNNKKESILKSDISFFERSSELQKAMGFKTSQWASILRVERKTIYNWKSNPDTEVQNRTKERLNVLDDFFNLINKNHAQYLAKIAFGRYADEGFRKALVNGPLTLEVLEDEYFRLYSELDGKYKRDKHRHGHA